ncbi:alpha/beta hydrolase [Yinghuangia sp. YIM S10712]|uniref:alpha/beta hydrolase n=1 Tax=Yinghuangia sp. YIM S10712 TaxID=3436930 RepID=UPI003F5318F1
MHILSTENIIPAVHPLPGPAGDAATAEASALFVHATGFHGRIWGPLARHLSGVDAHGIDLRGHGDTAAPEGYEFPWAAFGQDVLTAVDALPERPRKPIGIGHSLGGASLLLAEAARPGTFGALWLYEPAGLPPVTDPTAEPGEAPPGSVMINATRRRRAVFPDRADALKNYSSKPPMNAFEPDVLAAYVEHGFADDGGQVRLKCLPDNEAQVYLSLGNANVYDVMPDVKCPVLIVRGSGPEAEWLEGIEDRFPQGQAEYHADLSHFGPFTHSERLAGSISAWLRQTSAAD